MGSVHLSNTLLSGGIEEGKRLIAARIAIFQKSSALR